MFDIKDACSYSHDQLLTKLIGKGTVYLLLVNMGCKGWTILSSIYPFILINVNLSWFAEDPCCYDLKFDNWNLFDDGIYKMKRKEDECFCRSHSGFQIIKITNFIKRFDMKHRRRVWLLAEVRIDQCFSLFAFKAELSPSIKISFYFLQWKPFKPSS